MRRFLLTGLIFVVVAAVVPPLLASAFGWWPDPAALPAPEKTVPIADGRKLHIRELGEGVPVLLVHGLPSNAADWAELPARLVERGPYRVIAYDRIGYGYSSREESNAGGFSYESNARELGLLMDALELEKAVLVGWSYGGAVVQDFARTHPERVSHLVLVGSVGPLEVEEEGGLVAWVVNSALAVPIFDWVASIPPLSRAITRAELVRAFAREEEIPPDWLDYTRAVLALPGTMDAFVAESRRDDPLSLRPGDLSMPSLVIHGADDYLVPYHVAEDLHGRLPNSDFVTVLSGSHMLPVTHPELLAEKIHDRVGAY